MNLKPLQQLEYQYSTLATVRTSKTPLLHGPKNSPLGYNFWGGAPVQFLLNAKVSHDQFLFYGNVVYLQWITSNTVYYYSQGQRGCDSSGVISFYYLVFRSMTKTGLVRREPVHRVIWWNSFFWSKSRKITGENGLVREKPVQYRKPVQSVLVNIRNFFF